MVCQKTVPQRKEPLISSPLSNHPWEKLATGLFELNGFTYIVLVDHYSRFVEFQKLTSTTSASVIAYLKLIFSCYGIPATLISDNGPQFSSAEMKEFAEAYGFHHITTTPYINHKLMDKQSTLCIL